MTAIGYHQVNQSDALPKCVCANCWEKIEEFHKFHRSVRNAQEEYLKQIVKFEVENEHENGSVETTVQPKFVEVITNCDDLNEFDDEYSIKPNILDDTDEPEIKTDEFVDALYNDTIISDNFDEIEGGEEQTGTNKITTKLSLFRRK